MAVTVVEQSITGAAPSFTYTGAGWALATHPAASGGSYQQSTTVGNAVTLNIPTGKSGVIPVIDVAAGAVTVDVSVDGGAATRVTVGVATSTAAFEYYWWQALLPPIVLDSTVTHTVTITLVAGTLLIDAMLLADTSTAATYATIIGFGHSIMYGFNPTNAGQYAVPFISELAREIGFAATNNGLSAEDLTNGQSSSTNPQYFSNALIATPGWTRARGAAWLNTQPQEAAIMHLHNDAGYTQIYDDPTAGGFTDNLSNGAAAWSNYHVFVWIAAMTAGTWVLGYGGTNITVAYTQTVAGLNTQLSGAGIPYTASGIGGLGNVSGGGFILKANTAGAATAPTLVSQATTPTNSVGGASLSGNQSYLLVNSATLTGGTYTLTWNGLTTAAINPTDTAASITTKLSNAGIPFSALYLTTAGFNTGVGVLQVYSNSAPPLISQTAMSMTPTSLTGGTLALAGPYVLGRNASPAGAGWALARFKQRFKELLWLRNLACPTGITYCVADGHTATLDATTRPYNQAISDVCADPTVKNAWYVDIWDESLVPDFVNTDNVHPTQTGHYRIAAAINRVRQRKVRERQMLRSR